MVLEELPSYNEKSMTEGLSMGSLKLMSEPYAIGNENRVHAMVQDGGFQKWGYPKELVHKGKSQTEMDDDWE